MEIHTKVAKQRAVQEEMLVILICCTAVTKWTSGVESENGFLILYRLRVVDIIPLKRDGFVQNAGVLRKKQAEIRQQTLSLSPAAEYPFQLEPSSE